ncbi:glutamate--tRNA ligase [Halarcobacter ebronensis]|uniref:Glutamate--tRNA ligase n=1 Tax=Halarcobacter ebronensis TaxID=1462615 RepID=A0A4Q1AT65_9BACT|nr:glutamate--tRNA ligase [Halarcobacter ebronensis]QKF82027.1 glutamyl-tRNA synthetase [Halarcobacter ebronensis]RXK04139.1 glutamate--tRNA ligase [Halarcobacter ebronensis]
MLRFAQSLMHSLQLNDLRIAIFNYILSKQLNEPLMLVVNDLDKKNIIEGNDKEIIELLNLFSIDFSQVVYQSENLKYHQKLAMQLMGQKKAFACFCSDEKLDELKQEAKKENRAFYYDGFCASLSDETVLNCNAPFTVRAKMPDSNIVFADLLKGDFNFEPFAVDSFIILNHDKSATYNYACAVDDMLYDISLVIRNEKHILDTPKQIHIRNLLNYGKELKYLHLTDINFNKDDEKHSVKYFIDGGFLPSAIANYLVLLGNKTPTEIFTLEDAIKWFDIKNLSASSVNFDINKLKEINRKHLETLDDMRLSKILGFADSDIGKLAKLFLSEASTLKEIKSKIELIFSSKCSIKEFEKEFKEIKLSIQKAPFFDSFNDLKEYIRNNTKIDENIVLKLLRYLLTGCNEGPDISDIYFLTKNYLGEIIK